MTGIGWHKRLAALWLVLAVLAIAYNIKIWIVDRRPLETDFLALLPTSEGDPVAARALSELSNATKQNVLVVIGSTDWTRARTAARAYERSLDGTSEWFANTSVAAITSDSALAPWWTNRRGLLTAADRTELKTVAADAWVQRALRDMLSPLSTGRAGAWRDDPFGLFRNWIRERTSDTPVRPVDGVLRVDDGDMKYVVMPMRLRSQAFALATQRLVVPRLEAAKSAALLTAPDVRVLSAGLLFPAAASAAQANREFNTIGWGSILGIVLITWFTFRSLRPIGLILLSLGVGTVCAVAVTAYFYQNVHLITLVFGASLIGVAEDYGMHYLAMSDRHTLADWEAMRDAVPGLSLALLTTVASFLGLALSPFPGLRQMSLFSAAGLIAAWLTVVLWFPLLDGPQIAAPRIIAWFDRGRLRWLEIAALRGRAILGLLTAVFCVVGIARLHADDNIRLLQSLPDGMLREEADVSRILRAPFTAQLYVVRARSDTAVLRTEELLRARLDSLVARKALTSYQSVSMWVPSPERQRADAALATSALYESSGPYDRVMTTLGEPTSGAARETKVAGPLLTVGTWSASPISEPTRHLWLGRVGEDFASLITLTGVDDSRIGELRQATAGLQGVTWSDEVAQISGILGRYRVRMSWVLLVSYLLVWCVFLPRYGLASWRVVAPGAIASLVAIATLGVFGMPLQLFHVLALYLVFGLGVDYAIFLTERTHASEGDAWFGVNLAAASTVLSLGLLALSSTPVLRAFGLIMLIGTIVSMLAIPLFAARRVTPTDGATS